jgi:4-hydroxybenzoate polyprenyltransferase
MNEIGALVESMRPKSWTKNLFVFAAMIFGRVWTTGALLASLEAFLGFCLLSSSVYLMNDVADRRRDMHHPVKKLRPVPSGRLRVHTAAVAAGTMAGGVLVLSWTPAPGLALIYTIYLLMQAAYSARLKSEVILNCLIIALGFVLRAMAGVAVLDDTGNSMILSPWLIICTFFLASFLAFAKRRNEISVLGDGATGHRKNLREYTPRLLDQMMGVSAGASIMGYALYTVSQRTLEQVSPMLWVTVPFVAYGVFRYMYLVYTRGLGGTPDRLLLSDRPMILNIVLWAAVVYGVLRLSPAGP